jgi:hypothetical protein
MNGQLWYLSKTFGVAGFAGEAQAMCQYLRKTIVIQPHSALAKPLILRLP